MRRIGFTIIELLVVITIIGILMGAASIGVNNARKATRDSTRINDVLTIGKAIDQAATVSRGVYPQGVNLPNSEGNGILPNIISPSWLASSSSSQISLTYFSSTIRKWTVASPGNPNRSFYPPDSTIPTDPLPQAYTQGSSTCGDYRNGYMYHIGINQTGNTCTDGKVNIACTKHLAYTLEVGLESPRSYSGTQPGQSNGDTILQTAQDLKLSANALAHIATSTTRYAYYLSGPYIGGSCVDNNG